MTIDLRTKKHNNDNPGKILPKEAEEQKIIEATQIPIKKMIKINVYNELRELNNKIKKQQRQICFLKYFQW